MSRQTSRGTATVSQLCVAFGISRQAYYEVRPARAETLRKARAERPDIVPAELLREAITKVADENPAWGTRKVWASLRKADLRASYKRVWALMKAMGLAFAASTHRDVDTRGHVAVPASNRRWATDLTTAYTLRDGWVAVVPVIDCGDRVVFDIEVSKSQDSGSVLRPLERALEKLFGSPDAAPLGLELRTDHGPQYTGHDCKDFCNAWNLVHTFSPIGRPTGNAVVERFIQTLKVEVIWTRDWTSEDELRTAVHRWLLTYNNQRPHQALDWLTPMEKRTQNLRASLQQAVRAIPA